MSDKVLVDQPTKKPVRKLRAGGYVLAGLTVATYVFGAVQGQEVVSQEAALEAVGVLLAGGIPWISGYFAREEA